MTLAQVADLIVTANILADALDSFEKSGGLPAEHSEMYGYYQRKVESLIDMLSSMARELLEPKDHE